MQSVHIHLWIVSGHEFVLLEQTRGMTSNADASVKFLNVHALAGFLTGTKNCVNASQDCSLKALIVDSWYEVAIAKQCQMSEVVALHFVMIAVKIKHLIWIDLNFCFRVIP